MTLGSLKVILYVRASLLTPLVDQLHPAIGEFSFNCTGTVASFDWIRIGLLLPPRAAAAALV